MNGFEEYFAMGGDGRFIWSAYAVAALVLIGLAVASVWCYRARRSEFNVLQELDDGAPRSDDGNP